MGKQFKNEGLKLVMKVVLFFFPDLPGGDKVLAACWQRTMYSF